MSAAVPAQQPAVQTRGLFREVLAVLLLTVGSVLVGVGWLVGVALLWTSDRWRVGEKLLGTLVWPFGYAGLLLLGALPGVQCTSVGGGPETCTGAVLPLAPTIVLMVAFFGVPLLVAVFLLVRAHGRARS